MTIVDVLDGIDTRLKSIDGLRVADFKPGSAVVPLAFTSAPPITYHQTMQNGFIELRPTVTLLVSNTHTRAAQRQLVEFASPTGDRSIFAAVEADRTLSGAVEDCVVQEFDPFDLETMDLVGYVGGIFQLFAVMRGT